MSESTNSIVYQALRDYRRQIVGHIRQRFVETYTDAASAEFEKALKDLTRGSQVSAPERQDFRENVLGLNYRPIDPFDRLDIADFHNLFVAHWSVLRPGRSKSAGEDKRAQAIFLRDIDQVTGIRNLVSHSPGQDLPGIDASGALAAMKGILRRLGLDISDVLAAFDSVVTVSRGQIARERAKPAHLRKTTHRPRPAARWGRHAFRDTSFVGREEDLNRLSAAFGRGRRLIAVLGIGGTGKTRLVEEFVRRRASEIADRWLWVALDEVFEADQVAPLLLAHLGLAGARDSRRRLKRALTESTGRTLLILDNFEHVIAAADLIRDLRDSCPDLRILTTTQRRMGLQEEVLRLGALPLPSIDEVGSLEGLAEAFPAVRLLLDRSQEASVRLPLSANRELLELQRRIEGHPLAIEHLALRLAVQTPRELLEDFDRFLANEAIGMGQRHKSILGAILYGFTKMSKQGQDLLRVLAPFASGAKTNDVEAVAKAAGFDEGAVSSGLEDLLNWQFVLRRGDRLEWLDMIHRLAMGEALFVSQAEEYSIAHCDHFLGLLEGAYSYAGPYLAPQLFDIIAVQGDEANIRLAMSWATRSEARRARALRLAAGMIRFHGLAGWVTDVTEMMDVGRRIFAEVIANGPDDDEENAGAMADYLFAEADFFDDISPTRSEAQIGETLELALSLAETAGDTRLALAIAASWAVWADYANEELIMEQALLKQIELATRMGDKVSMAHAASSLGHLIFPWKEEKSGALGEFLAYEGATIKFGDDQSRMFRIRDLLRIREGPDEVASFDHGQSTVDQSVMGEGPRLSKETLLRAATLFEVAINATSPSDVTTPLLTTLLATFAGHDLNLPAGALDLAGIQIYLGQYEEALATLAPAIDVEASVSIAESFGQLAALLLRISLRLDDVELKAHAAFFARVLRLGVDVWSGSLPETASLAVRAAADDLDPDGGALLTGSEASRPLEQRVAAEIGKSWGPRQALARLVDASLAASPPEPTTD